MSDKFEMKDSGQRESFTTGAVRDVREGKGRYDLVSPFALKRLAIVYEKGAQKYSNRNWEKGMPHTRYYDSAIRHLGQWLMGDTDEDHLAHAMWNVAAIIHMQELHPELDDRPDWKKPEEPKIGLNWEPKNEPSCKPTFEELAHQCAIYESELTKVQAELADLKKGKIDWKGTK